MRRFLMLVLLASVGCGSAKPDDETAEVTESSYTPLPPKRPSQNTPSDESVTPPSSEDGGAPTFDPEAPCPAEKPYVCGAPGGGFECRDRACPPSCERVPCPTAFTCVDCGDGPACVPHDHATCR